MVAQTSMSPRAVTATLSKATVYNNQATAYNSALAYNQPTATNGNAKPRAVSAAVASPRITSSASMKAR